MRPQSNVSRACNKQALLLLAHFLMSFCVCVSVRECVSAVCVCKRGRRPYHFDDSTAESLRDFAASAIFSNNDLFQSAVEVSTQVRESMQFCESDDLARLVLNHKRMAAITDSIDHVYRSDPIQYTHTHKHKHISMYAYTNGDTLTCIHTCFWPGVWR